MLKNTYFISQRGHVISSISVTLVTFFLLLNVHCGVLFSTDPPLRYSKAPTKQSPGNKKEIITKHDSTVCGRRNVKIMEKVSSRFLKAKVLSYSEKLME